MKPGPTIRLWNDAGLGVIVAFPSGVVYSNQTGGFSCLHPELEGIHLPLGAQPGEELFAYFAGSKHRGAGATSGLDDEDAAFIEGVLARHDLSGFVSLDRGRLRESHEAWVWAFVTRDDGDGRGPALFHGLGPYPRAAILTWNNTD